MSEAASRSRESSRFIRTSSRRRDRPSSEVGGVERRHIVIMHMVHIVIQQKNLVVSYYLIWCKGSVSSNMFSIILGRESLIHRETKILWACSKIRTFAERSWYFQSFVQGRFVTADLIPNLMIKNKACIHEKINDKRPWTIFFQVDNERSSPFVFWNRP